MKKIILFLSALFISIGLFAQGDIGLTTNGTYREYTGTAADTVKATASINKVIKIDKDYLYYYEVLADIDTLVGDYGVSCVLSGSNDNVSYSTITDVTFAGTADTIIRYTNLASTASQTMGSYTLTQPTFNVTADTAGLSGYFADTLVYPQVITTVGAQTVTVPTEVGVMWRFLKLTLTGDNASTSAELEAIKVKVVKVP